MLAIGLETITVTISAASALSPSISLGAKTLVGISMPAGWDAAALSFQSTPDGTTFQDLHDVNGEITMSAAAAVFMAVDPALWRGVNQIKVRSGTSASPVNQSADRVISLLVRPLA